MGEWGEGGREGEEDREGEMLYQTIDPGSDSGSKARFDTTK